jgi:hypothetical protein
VSGTGNGYAPVERNPQRGVVSRRWEWRRQVNREVLIGTGHWLTFNLSRKEGDASAALG